MTRPAPPIRPAPRPRRRDRPLFGLPGAVLGTLFLLPTLFLAPSRAVGQGGEDGFRFGISVGGISTAGVIFEFFDDDFSLDVNVGTWSFRDISVAVTVRHYFGASDVQPVAGLGLWGVLSLPESGEQTGMALMIQAPLGFDWETVDGHFVGGTLNINRGLWIRRTDPDDETPMNRRLVPLPGLYYRWRP